MCSARRRLGVPGKSQVSAENLEDIIEYLTAKGVSAETAGVVDKAVMRAVGTATVGKVCIFKARWEAQRCK